MQKTLVMAMIVSAAALVGGCRKNGTADVAQAPPPPEPELMEPVPYDGGGTYDPMSTAPQPDAGAAGGGAGFEPTPIPAPEPVGPAAGTAAAGGSYTIQKGDTLWAISKRVYGTGQRWPDIVAANPGLDPKRLPVGKAIVLP